MYQVTPSLFENLNGTKEFNFIIESAYEYTLKLMGMPRNYFAFYWNMVILISIIFMIFFIYYLYFYTYFKRRGVKSLAFPLPFIGNNFSAFFGFQTPMETISSIYEEGKNNPLGIVGWYDMDCPVLSICKKKTMEKILKDKGCLDITNYQELMDQEQFHLTSLYLQKNLEWCSMKKYFVLSFNDTHLQNHLKHLVPVAQNLDEYLLSIHDEKKISQKKQFKDKYDEKKLKVSLDVKDIFSRFVNDSIFTCAFGIEQNSFSDDKMANENYKHVKNLTSVFTRSKISKCLSVERSKVLTEFFFPYGVYLKESENHLVSLFAEQLKQRKSGQVIRDDLLQMLVEKRPELEDEFIFSQLLLFFLEGFDTVSTCLSLIAMQLAEHPHIQEKLFLEMIRENTYTKDEKDDIFYDRLQRLDYMDCVIKESLRRYPVVLDLERICDKEFIITSPEEDCAYTVDQNQRIHIPVYGFHQDPNIFTQPKLFIPERFEKNQNIKRNFIDINENDNAKSNNLDEIFLGFGAGPRKCTGLPFARIAIKTALSIILRHFEFIPNHDTPLPMKMKNSINITPEPNGFMLSLRRRIQHEYIPIINYPKIITKEDIQQINGDEKVISEKEKLNHEETLIPNKEKAKIVGDEESINGNVINVMDKVENVVTITNNETEVNINEEEMMYIGEKETNNGEKVKMNKEDEIYIGEKETNNGEKVKMNKEDEIYIGEKETSNIDILEKIEEDKMYIGEKEVVEGKKVDKAIFITCKEKCNGTPHFMKK